LHQGLEIYARLESHTSHYTSSGILPSLIAEYQLFLRIHFQDSGAERGASGTVSASTHVTLFPRLGFLKTFSDVTLVALSETFKLKKKIITTL
jgi:hypothetical protein